MKKTKTNLLRAGRLALAVAVSPLLATTASATLTTYSPGDVFIGFRQTGVANTLVAKIGTTRDFLPTSLGGNRTPGVPYQVPFGVNPTNSTPVTNLSLDLAAVFGSSWAFNPTDGSGVRWGVVGWTGNTGEASSVDGLALRSLFVTRGRTNPSEQTNVTNIGNRGGFATEFTSFAYGTGGGSYINNESTVNSSVAYIGAASDPNNWGTRIQGNAGFGLGSNRAVDQTPLSGAFSGPTDSVLDLWLSPNTGSTLVATNTYLGSFTLSANGSLSFTPAGSAPPSQAPVITSALTANGTVGTPFTYAISASNNATSFAATLSQTAGAATANLSVNTATGLISGTPINPGIASVPISATNAAGTGNASLTLNIAAAVTAPAITSNTSASGQVGTAFSYQITASNNATSFGAAGLPAGLSVNSTTGLISGTPTAAGNSSVAISATNSGGTGNATLNLSISPAPVVAPVITSNTSASGRVGIAFSYQITASNNATSFGATGLPAGLSVNSTSGLISGTPTAAGNSSVTINATNSGGTGNATLTLSIVPQPPGIQSALSASVESGRPFSYQISASNNPTSFGATGLPAGLSVNSTTGLISGTPSAVGNSSVTITATNAGGTGNATLRLSVTPAPAAAPRISSPTTQTARIGQAFSYQIAASNNPTSFSATGLPGNLTINTATGLISGTPNTLGNFTVALRATNSRGTGNATLRLSVLPLAPVVSVNGTVNGVQGGNFSYQISATNNPTRYAATGLPTGLTVNATTGLISGKPTRTGNFTANLTATNAGGNGTASLRIVVTLPPKPLITSFTTANGTVGGNFSYQISATNNPTRYAATGLPTGLTVNATTGLISGKPTQTGNFTANLTATNAGGNGTASLRIVVTLPPAPLITSSTTATGKAGTNFTYQILGTNNPTRYAATGLPSELRLNTTTGVISGRPARAGTITANLTATNAGGNGTATLTITIAP